MEKQQGYKIIICQKNKIIDAFYGKNEYTQDLGMEEHSGELLHWTRYKIFAEPQRSKQ